MKILTFIFFIYSVQIFANADLLLNQVDNNPIESKIIVNSQKRLNLDDPFLVQFYAKWKSLNHLPFELNNWAQLIIDHDFKKAAHLITVIKDKTPKDFLLTFHGANLYLYWKLGLKNTFLDQWLDVASNTDFLNHEISIAIDQLITQDESKWLVENGIELSPDQVLKLKTISTTNSKFYNILMAINALRSGENALEWIGKLNENDPLRFYLAQTLILNYSKNNQLAHAAKLLKEIYEPKLNKSNNTEEISSYYLLLARLLYQAGALDAASDYYQLIPQASKYFLNARVENLWITLRKNDVSKLKGEVTSFELDIFNNSFLPEVFLVSSISNLKLCQFENVKKTFVKFIAINSKWSQLIEKNILSENPTLIEEDDFFVKLKNNALKSLALEKTQLLKLSRESIEAVVPAIGEQIHWQAALDYMNKSEERVIKNKTVEIRRKWLNRKQILASVIKKMRFVKIEYISLLRKFSNQLAINTDSVSVYNAATAKTNQIDFPFDGLIWGDEPFQLSAQVRSLCLRGIE